MKDFNLFLSYRVDASIQKKCLKGHDLEVCSPYLQLLLNAHLLTVFYICVMINENISNGSYGKSRKHNTNAGAHADSM